MKKIGILAIQGDFEKHKSMVSGLGYVAEEVRTQKELDSTNALIIPGGESTTFLNLFTEFGLQEPIKQYAKNRPIMGTCAGLIVLSSEVEGLSFTPLGLIDIVAQRNAYGRQKESFIDNISIQLNGNESEFMGVFIRAPKIHKFGSSVQALGTHEEDVVLAASKNILICTFHPELTEDTRIHNFFLNNFLL